ncbi:TOBE domain-containing protein [Mesorhizobium sp. CO1-1-8]|uniref:TOBE domain-containing protein n=1 Tax=Mesorhizobium sp. CO1-1-8 TaxID=2876631 RepID=UPI001CD05744|nr:TOBE domain-containing protein [Mesorhizobium sp. CO1-1-8]MBZ9773414.1 TOBE domain-containing protein [Mesorhizobium sp. CO1-1-8]
MQIVLVRPPKKGAVTSHVRINIGGAIVTASITMRPSPKLEKGKQAYAAVKASDVMVGID